MGEVDGAQVRAQVAECGPDECQVVVLDEDPAAVGGDGGHPLGDLPVELAVRVPRLHPPPIGTRSAGRVEEVVVTEPEGPVRDHVVGEVVEGRIRFDELDAQALDRHQPGGSGGPVALAERAGNPGCARAGDEGVQRSGQPAPHRTGYRHAVLDPERERSPVGDEHGIRQRPTCCGRWPVPRSGGGVDTHADDATPAPGSHRFIPLFGAP